MNGWVEVIKAKTRGVWLSSYRLLAWHWSGVPEWRLSSTCHIYRRRCLLHGGAPLRVKR